jgi:hypothetical protein
MTVDIFVLVQTIGQYHTFKLHADDDVFSQCYKPQLVMRVIFTCYAINAAGLCFALTFGLLQEEHRLERLALWLFHYSYVAFGPVLLLLCGAFGVPAIPGLLYRCELARVNKEQVHTMDVMIVLGCTLFSAFVTLMYALVQAMDSAQKGLRDERSLFYRVYRQILRMKANASFLREGQLGGGGYGGV